MPSTSRSTGVPSAWTVWQSGTGVVCRVRVGSQHGPPFRARVGRAEQSLRSCQSSAYRGARARALPAVARARRGRVRARRASSAYSACTRSRSACSSASGAMQSLPPRRRAPLALDELGEELVLDLAAQRGGVRLDVGRAARGGRAGGGERRGEHALLARAARAPRRRASRPAWRAWRRAPPARGAWSARQSANASRKRARLRSPRNSRNRVLRRGPRAWSTMRRRRGGRCTARESQRHGPPRVPQRDPERARRRRSPGRSARRTRRRRARPSRREHEARRADVVDGARIGGRASATMRLVAPSLQMIAPSLDSSRRAAARAGRPRRRPGARAASQQPRGAARAAARSPRARCTTMRGARLAQREVPAADDAEVDAVVEDPGPPSAAERARVGAHLVIGVVEHEQQLGRRASAPRSSARPPRRAVDVAREDRRRS